MSLSKNWEDQKIYRSIKKGRDFTKRIYRCSTTGLEAFIIGETKETYLIEGNGVKCKIWKKYSKSKIFGVEEDYVLRKK